MPPRPTLKGSKGRGLSHAVPGIDCHSGAQKARIDFFGPGGGGGWATWFKPIDGQRMVLI